MTSSIDPKRREPPKTSGLMERYDFYFQVVTGTVLIFFCCLLAVGISSPTVTGGKVVEPGAPFWASLASVCPVVAGIYFCAFAFWRARRRTNNLAWVFAYGATFFYLLLKANKDEPELDDPSRASVILAIITLAVISTLFLLYDRVFANRVISKISEAKAADWNLISKLAFLGRLFVFVICLAIALTAVYLKVFQSESIKLTVFVIVLLLGCFVSGLISEKTAKALLPWFRK